MRSLLLAFALTTSLVALSTVPAYAQTDQTDQSEEDWRKSRKKRDTSDIFEDIKNSGVFGSGTMQGPPNPVEALPEDSRRHIMKERARVIATTETGQAPDTTYNPSEEAKNDPGLAEQEKEAWDVIMTDMKGTGGQGQPGDGPNKVAVAGQGGAGSPSNSNMRGGSSQSVADILAQIKGLKSGSLGGGSGTQGSGSGQGPLGTGSGSSHSGPQAGSQQSGSEGQSQQGQQAGRQVGTQSGGQSQGQSQQAQGQQGQEQQGQAQQASVQNGAQSQNQGQSQNTDSSADASEQSNSSADSSQAASEAAVEAKAEAEAMAHAQHESIGPLDRIKHERATSGIGSNTSASDFLKKKTSD
ncbi:MAG: hypothetical protein EX271_03725 [Acidimicrobiales bacterium]|nr:hypothetical protein [Hyphomonadaceae bacterium]RZV43522.1 MAG: hypothetical protein EX271_03725 [Acidimicrobiales bacterium]